MYYRSTPAVRRMLSIAMTTIRPDGMCADNDQYLLNCGFAHAAVEGLKYRMLPPDEFSAGASPGTGGRRVCTDNAATTKDRKTLEESAKRRYIGDGKPYTWHTYGFSGSYIPELDMFAAWDLLDVDASTGKCLEGQRGSEDDAEQLREKGFR